MKLHWRRWFQVYPAGPRPIVGNLPWWSGWYWKRRCLVVERRMREYEKEIQRLKGGRPLTWEEVNKHNERLLCEKHRRFPCRECGTKHHSECRCYFCR